MPMTFRDVLLAQLNAADIPHLALSGPLGPEIEIELPTGERVVLTFDRQGDLLAIENADEAQED